MTRTPEESFDGLILEADWADMHGGGHHDDNCEVCRDIANVRTALETAAVSQPAVQSESVRCMAQDKADFWFAQAEKNEDRRSHYEVIAGQFQKIAAALSAPAAQAVQVTHEMVAAVVAAKCGGCGAYPYEDCKRGVPDSCFRLHHGGGYLAVPSASRGTEA